MANPYVARHEIRAKLETVCLSALLALGTTSAFAGIVISTVHTYVTPAGTVEIDTTVQDNYLGDFSKYWWQYDVKNISFAPADGNGLSGFELALPAFPSDLGNASAPAGWNNNCCSGLPEEWDHPQPGDGILPGADGLFSFTSLPRPITNSTGWIHSWSAAPGSFQVDIFTYDSTGTIGPEVPSVVPEPATLLLLASGLAAIGFWGRAKRNA